MAEIAPIRGVLYDPTRVDASKVIAPPYDVINDADRKALEAKDPHNCVRLILPDGEGDAKYENAAALFKAWQDAGVLKRDARPAIYRYHQLFRHAELGDREVTRRGFIAAVKLHKYDEGVIRPHERTLRGPKEDRLKLMRAARAHFSQIFGLYKDPSLTTDDAFTTVEKRKPDLEGTTADGTVHRLWRVADRETIAAVARVMAPLPVYIADGHHRYETMLALRDELRGKDPKGYLPPHASAEFATFFLCNVADPGLIVLPTHRLLHAVAKLDKADLLQRAAAYFTIETIDGAAKDAVKLKDAIAASSQTRPTFAVVFPGDDAARLFSVKNLEAVLDELTATSQKAARVLLQLDVTLLHTVVLEKLLGIDRAAQEAQTNLKYVKDTREALERVQQGEAQVGFIMHPTRVQQVVDVANAHETMPQKSTFFYPKIASGLVINPISPDEDLDRAV